MPREGILFVLVGPSGAGKNTLMKRVQEQVEDLQQLATVTTRTKREGEMEGREHHFISGGEFQKLIDTDALVEWQRVHLNDLYGTPRQTVDNALNASRDLIADIECLGAAKLREAYRENTVLIFVTPSRLDILAERILHRGNITPEALVNRLERAKFEMLFAPECDYLVLNDEVDPATEQLLQIIASEHSRRGPHPLVERNSVVPTHIFHVTVTVWLRHEDNLLVRANSPDIELPAFSAADLTSPLHETLQADIQQNLGVEIEIDAISDSRFDFVAPNHVTIASMPPDIYLNFYYKAVLRAAQPMNIPGWEWRSLSSLNLPMPVNP